MLKLNVRFENLDFIRGATVESIRERMEDADVLNALSEKRLAVQKELIAELAAFRKSLVAKTKGNTRRFLKAYPHLNRGYRMHHKKNK